MNLIYVAEADDFKLLFWGIVIAIFIIVQIAKSRKKFSESAPRQDKPSSSGGGDPAEELRKFLEGLGQAQEQPPPPPPAPVAAPSPPPATPPHRRVAVHRAKARVATPPPVRREPEQRPVAAPAPEAQAPDEVAVLARYRAEMAAAAVAAPAHVTTKWRAVLVADLRGAGRHPARKAVIMREILGAPIALRRREVVYPLV